MSKTGCNVCKNAGKSSAVFTSHFPKDFWGRVICPTLLGKKVSYSCKVCKDAEKPEAIYTSHNVKDLSGKVVCPTLLNQSCKNCSKRGHTVKYCTEPSRMSIPIVPKQEALPKKTMTVAPVGRFAALDYDDDTEDEEEELTKMEIMIQRKEKNFPPLSANVTLRPHQMNWVNAVTAPRAATAKVVPVDVEDVWSSASRPPPLPSRIILSEKEIALSQGLRNGTIKWADIESDDDDEW